LSTTSTVKHPGVEGKAVKLEWLDTIAVVSMEDRATKNRFSEALIDGLRHVFHEIERQPLARVVVVHGYDQYFCCGGTEAELLLLASGKVQFTAFAFYDQLLKCNLPVIAAMQGHAIGGGLVFGAYADLMVLAEECLYSANFMEYGFTPGLGATCIIPKKFGLTLGWEMLFTARNYHGGELRERGAPVRVAPRGDVLRLSMELARDLAGKPVEALKELKRCFAESLQADLQTAVQKELRMHQVTFLRPEVQERIAARYGR